MDAKDTKETKKTGTRAADCVSVVVLCAAVALCLVVAVQVAVRGYADMFGYSVFRVVTGSMEPTIPVNAVVVSHREDIERMSVDDIVVFRSPTTGGERIITHRVVAVYTESDGTTTLETRGDANPVSDSSPVTQSQLIGRVVWYLDKEGGATRVIGFLSSSMGFIACIVFPILLLGALILRGSINSIRQQLWEVEHQLDEELPPEPSLTEEEYEEICRKVRAELMEELKENHE